MSDVIAILCSDIHLSHKVPIARSAEPNWYDAMRRPLNEIIELQSLPMQKDGLLRTIPVVCAGDIFDSWKNSPPELINFALENLPSCMYCVPGQHDLPNHRMDEIEKTPYWSLVLARRIQNIDRNPVPLMNLQSYGLILHGFPWNKKITPLEESSELPPEIDVDFEKENTKKTHLAVVHSYIWKNGFGYPGADEEKKVGKYRKSLEGYDAAVFGDNHQGFIVDRPGKATIMNCGTLMRRKIDEIDYKPQVGLLKADGWIEPHFLDTSKDRFTETRKAKAQEKEILDAEKFLDELKSLGADSLDFRDALNKYMDDNKTSQQVREMVLESVE